jgi:GNAT superfamily N-acetyltransferase
MAQDALAIRPTGVEPRQISAYADLLGQVFGDGGKFTAEAVAWRYRDNPAGVVVGADAWDGERLAAHYVACPTLAMVAGTLRRGLLSLNTATHPDYQGRGLFTRLAEATYQAGAEAGYEFVIGVANANSTPGFLRKLAFQNVGALHAGVLARRPRAFSDAALQYRAEWTPELLAWRLANPAGRYRTGRQGQLTGVFAKTHLPAVWCSAFLPGYAPAPDVGGAPAGFSLFIGLEPRCDFERLGFLPVPQRFRPSPLNLIWRSLGAAPEALEAGAVSLNFLDFDPY